MPDFLLSFQRPGMPVFFKFMYQGSGRVSSVVLGFLDVIDSERERISRGPTSPGMNGGYRTASNERQVLAGDVDVWVSELMLEM